MIVSLFPHELWPYTLIVSIPGAIDDINNIGVVVIVS